MKNFGFGCMRLPMKDGEVDKAQFAQMVERFIAGGFCYFDTAHVYLEGKSETALRECLTSRFPRESYILTNKLSNSCFEKEADIRPFFEAQLAACGVDYFDYYLMHSQNALSYEKYIECGAYRIAGELKAEGKVKHVGLSFHDKAEVLDKILTEQPCVEVVQIQFNYVDYDSPSIESGKCLEVCRRHAKPVIIMEPVKGGSLASLPESAKSVLAELGPGSPASYAIRYAASFDGVMMVLSGMSTIEQLEENIGFMKDFEPLSEAEFAAIDRVCDIFKQQHLIPCTACRYCVDGCPANIPIPDLLACLNAKKQFGGSNGEWYYSIHTQTAGKASDCVGCGQCEDICPQHLKIRSLLEEAAREFEK